MSNRRHGRDPIWLSKTQFSTLVTTIICPRTKLQSFVLFQGQEDEALQEETALVLDSPRYTRDPQLALQTAALQHAWLAKCQSTPNRRSPAPDACITELLLDQLHRDRSVVLILKEVLLHQIRYQKGRRDNSYCGSSLYLPKTRHKCLEAHLNK